MDTYVRDAIRVSQGTGFIDEPLKARWQSLYSPDTANVLCFSPSGDFVTLGTTDGSVLVWEFASCRTLVRTLRLPVEALEGGEGGGVLAVAWSFDSRLLFAGTACAVVVYDIASGLPLRVLKLEGLLGSGNVVRMLRPHPIYRNVLLVVPWLGMPWLLEWSGKSGECGLPGGSAHQLSDSILPPPKKRVIRAQLAREASVKGGRVKGLRCDAIWGGANAPSPGTLYLYTSRGDLCRLRIAALEGELLNSVTNDSSQSPSTPLLAVYRMAYTLTATPVLPPEIHSVSGCGGPSYTSSTPIPFSLPGHADACNTDTTDKNKNNSASSSGGGAHHLLPPAIVITTRNGVVFHDIVDLRAGERYNEPVDNTLMVTARVGRGGSVVYALPSEDAGHAAGGMYAFKRGNVGDIRLKRPPPESGGLVRIAVHPISGIIAAIGSRGSAFILQEPLIVSWPGPMYPPGQLCPLNPPPQAPTKQQQYKKITAHLTPPLPHTHTHTHNTQDSFSQLKTRSTPSRRMNWI